jgi:hypothetical protein
MIMDLNVLVVIPGNSFKNPKDMIAFQKGTRFQIRESKPDSTVYFHVNSKENEQELKKLLRKKKPQFVIFSLGFNQDKINKIIETANSFGTPTFLSIEGREGTTYIREYSDIKHFNEKVSVLEAV